jgi:hypothetical protein
MVNVVATVQHDRVLEVDGEFEKRPHLQLESLQHNKKKILFVTSEFADLVKVGGWVMSLQHCRVLSVCTLTCDCSCPVTPRS